MINADKPERWKDDIWASVDQYNQWFLGAAPRAYRETRTSTAGSVLEAFAATNNLRGITPDVLALDPGILPTLRMSTAPPIARDRLSGLSEVPKTLVKSMEDGRIPPQMAKTTLMRHLQSMCTTLNDLLDVDLYPWLADGTPHDSHQLELATAVVADRLCRSLTDPIIKNAQEQRQLAVITDWLERRGYRQQAHPPREPLQSMAPGTFSFRMNVLTGDSDHTVNIPIDAVIQPHTPLPHGLPILVEAKSAGDFTNTNKRRKEEATKVRQLRATYGEDIALLLFLCGYFDAGYLGYEAAEGLDWVWEHRIDDMAEAGA